MVYADIGYMSPRDAADSSGGSRKVTSARNPDLRVAFVASHSRPFWMS